LARAQSPLTGRRCRGRAASSTAHAVKEFAPLDLVFADARDTSMSSTASTPPGASAAIATSSHLLGDPTLVCAEVDFASGVIVATKRPV